MYSTMPLRLFLKQGNSNFGELPVECKQAPPYPLDDLGVGTVVASGNMGILLQYYR